MLCYAKSLQSCQTLYDPMDQSPPGSSVHGILQASILEWVVISFSNIYIYTHTCINIFMGFPGVSDGKESAHNAGDLGLIPRSGRSTGKGNGNPLQYSCHPLRCVWLFVTPWTAALQVPLCITNSWSLLKPMPHIYKHTYIFDAIYMCVYIYIYIHTHTCTYIYCHILHMYLMPYVYTHTHTHTHTYIWLSLYICICHMAYIYLNLPLWNIDSMSSFSVLFLSVLPMPPVEVPVPE